MLSCVLRTVRAHGLLDPGDRVLVAVSGGPDSMALLHTLWELGGRLGITLEAVTVDHGLRPEARTEADLVRDRAAALEVPWHLARVDVAAARRRDGGSLQEAARAARLAALAELAARLGARRIALGHQADDQAETVLFRIVRGTGLRGLRGIPDVRGPFVRPLLDVSRAEILRYLGRRSIPFASDPSNDDPRFARARVRHRLLPLLRQENPRVGEALVGLAAAARRLPDAGPVRGRRVVEVAYGKVRVRARPDAPAPEPPLAPVAVAGPGVYPWPGGEALVVSTDTPARERADRGGACFDADALAWPLTLRTRRPGDRMRPRGGRGSRKLSDLLIDAKVPRGARGRLPVLAAADGVVLYVPGLRPAERGRPTASTLRLVRISISDAKTPARSV
jgi:tRNA(Ile)-lysidine synthase